MSFSRRARRSFGALLFILAISAAGYVAISDLAGKQSQQQQQSVSPIFGLIESELVHPLHLAKTLDKIGVYKEYFSQELPDEKTLINQLKYYSALFDLEFYVAHDKSRKQYNSDGRVFELIEGQVIWYFALKNEFDSDVQAVLGKREDVHLYIDVRQYDNDGNFIGFIGIGKSLNDFIVSFEKYKSDYGHEFLFVNNRGEIVLSSRTDLLPSRSKNATSSIEITDIAELDWYESFAQETKGQIEPSLVVNSTEGDLLVSQFRMETLNWSLYLLTPLSARQQEVNKSYVIYIGVSLLILLVLYKVAHRFISYFSSKMSRKLNYDPLTRLANRHYAQLFFSKCRRRHQSMAILLIDLDHFTQLNESFGHNAGDKLLISVAECILENIRLEDLAVRWSGQQFMVILPDIEIDAALTMAEKCRIAIGENKITVLSSFIHTTASIGLSYTSNLSNGFNIMIDGAEQGMRKAKASGKNKVVKA